MPGETTPPVPIYQLKIILRRSSPPIWRRIQVPADIGLARLHLVIQDVMGWEDCHLHEFAGSGRDRRNVPRYGVPNSDLSDMQDEQRFCLNQLLTAPRQKLIYEYDFGDCWEHDVVLEKILPPDPEARYPLCVAGARACPPEDSGGVWGYQALCEAMADPESEDYAQYAEWVGEEFDPEAFDLEAINGQFQPARREQK
jgi:hypothetical protein